MATNQDREEMYRRASTRSAVNEEGGFTILAADLDRVVEIPFGCQLLGIASSGNQVVVADYNGPALWTSQFTRDANGLHFQESWITGAENSVRMFPDILPSSGANRTQTVNFGPNGTLWITRNADAEIFILAPSREITGSWSLVDRIVVPEAEVIHSALLEGDTFYTVETDYENKNWMLKAYHWDETRLSGGDVMAEIPDLTYGIAAHKGTLWFTKSCQAEGSRGLFRLVHDSLEIVFEFPSFKLPYPDEGEEQHWGNGIAFLGDDIVAVTRYGSSYRASRRGVSGALLLIPSSFIS